MLLSIIIVSYNTADLTYQAVKSCLKQVEKSKLLASKTELFWIDNHSTDQSLPKISSLKSTTTQITLVKNKQNLGFARANNQGIKLATGKYIFLLNSDTQLKSQALENLIKTFKRHPTQESSAHLSSYGNKIDKLGILAAELINPDGSTQMQGGSLPSLTSLTSHMLFLDDLPLIGKFLPSTQHTGKAGLIRSWGRSSKHPQVKDWVAATAIMVKSEVFEEVGLLDENIFMYGEDIEFCIRAKNHHWDIAIDPSAQVIHYGSASSSALNALSGEFMAYQYIWAKHKPLWQRPFVKLLLTTGAYLRFLLFALLWQKSKSAAYQNILKKLN